MNLFSSPPATNTIPRLSQETRMFSLSCFLFHLYMLFSSLNCQCSRASRDAQRQGPRWARLDARVVRLRHRRLHQTQSRPCHCPCHCHCPRPYLCPYPYPSSGPGPNAISCTLHWGTFAFAAASPPPRPRISGAPSQPL